MGSQAVWPVRLASHQAPRSGPFHVECVAGLRSFLWLRDAPWVGGRVCLSIHHSVDAFGLAIVMNHAAGNVYNLTYFYILWVSDKN